ncbi:MAG: S8 family serine peptidase [Candidatus Zixiibacteriota bacterium]
MKINLIVIVLAGLLICPVSKGDTTSVYDPFTVVTVIKDAVLTGPVSGKVAVSSAIADTTLLHFLDSTGATNICRIFPDFDPADTISTDRHGETVRLINLAEYYTLEFADSVWWHELAAAYGEDSAFTIVDQKYYRQVCKVTPNDPYYQYQWHLQSVREGAQNVDSAWEYTTGDTAIKLCVIDVGVHTGHVDLINRISEGFNGFDNSTNIHMVSIGDEHGTLVTGLIGAEGNNAAVVAGVNWQSPILYGKAGTDPTVDPVAGVRCIDWARRRDASVVSMSWGTYGGEYAGEEAAATYNAWKSDILLFAAKGNDATATTHYPSDLFGVIGVGACIPQGARSSFSNYGPNLDLMAAGEGIVTTSTSGGVTSTQGTSMSTPIAAGVASLILSYKKDLTADEVEQIMQLTALDRGDPGWDQFYGWGVVKADAALHFVANNSFFRKEAIGGNRQMVQGLHGHVFINSHGDIASGVYFVETYSVRSHFDFADYNFTTPPEILLRNRVSNGWSAANPNNEQQYMQVVPGSVTSSGCDVESFAYFIKWDISGQQYNQWWPCDNPPCNNGPDIKFKITVAGKPHVAAASNLTAFPVVYDAMSEGRYQAIRLQWTDPNSFESGWVIQRRAVDSVSWETLDTTGPMLTPSFYDSSFVGSETYAYRIWPLPVDETPQYSPEVTVTAKPRWPDTFTGGTVMAPGCFVIPVGKQVAGKIATPAPPDSMPDDPCLTNKVELNWTRSSRQKPGNLTYKVRQLYMSGPYMFEYYTTPDEHLEIAR